MIYIDADHTYEAVHADATASIAKLMPNGMVIFNDYINVRSYRQHALRRRARRQRSLRDAWLEAHHMALQDQMFADVALARPGLSRLLGYRPWL